MENVKNQDERVLAQRRKIQSDGFQLLIYALLLSILVQQFFLQAPPRQYMAEFLCLVGTGFYNLIRNLNLGDLLSYFLTFTMVFGGMTYLIYYLSKKKQDKIKSELDMDEDEI